MELRHIRYFLAVAEELNFTRAARRIGIGQPPLSNQIRDLEEEIGAPLFRRLPHGAELTEAGQVFLREARAILTRAGQAKALALRAARGELGRLRVGFTGSAAFSPIVPSSVRSFRRTYPEIDLTLEEAHTTRLLERLDAEELDAVFIRPGRTGPPGFRSHVLGEESMVIALPSSHPLAEADTLPLSTLSDEPFVLFPRAAGPSLFDEIIAACRRAGFEPILGQIAPQITSIANLIAVELGVSVVPLAVAEIQVPGVSYIPISGDGPVARLALATRRDECSAVVRNFIARVLATKAELG
ncbi:MULTISPECIES: LysR family transcriptional regulator [Rhizobium]|uniref:HTH-type transcriptional regulator TtuA n=1 Tax=Rhizobium rhizogenes (strain K84 / ATCC BAA-868) TaxID=311403 RepID=B9J8D6_RHIR8|nr:LysR family transcriptional regulator [Rhizobium sp. AP16]ACM25323.1 transcriptional regulator protein [Rhizobium rhizogenes K84]EJK82834.1 transcriptional regulator [Rhizobium sp. AP16]